MKGIIVGPNDGGEGVYTLLAEDGEGMCSHFCSGMGFAMGDLYSNRPERKKMFEDKGITEVVYLRDSGFTQEEMIARNKKFHEKDEDK